MGTIFRVFKWGLLPVSIIANVVGYSLDTQQIVEWGIPSWSLYIIGYCLIVLFFIAIISGLWQDNKHLKADLKEAKRYEVKSQRIEIISKEKYPSEILRIFDDMRRCLSEIIESSDSVQDVTPEILATVSHGSPRDLARAISQKTIDDNVYVTNCFYNKFRAGIGLIDLKEKNAKWRELNEELETVKKDIPDQKLKDSVMSHFDALNGENSIRLFYRYMRRCGVSDFVMKTVEPFRPLHGLTDETLTRVSNRILELKLGEEPKWETRHFEILME